MNYLENNSRIINEHANPGRKRSLTENVDLLKEQHGILERTKKHETREEVIEWLDAKMRAKHLKAVVYHQKMIVIAIELKTERLVGWNQEKELSARNIFLWAQYQVNIHEIFWYITNKFISFKYVGKWWTSENLTTLQIHLRYKDIWRTLPAYIVEEWEMVRVMLLLGKQWTFNLKWDREIHRIKKLKPGSYEECMSKGYSRTYSVIDQLH